MSEVRRIEGTLQGLACEYCGSGYERKRQWGRYCSDRCRVASHQLERAVQLIGQHLLGVSEAARLLAVSPSTIRRRIGRGELRARRLVGRLLVYRRDVSGRRAGEPAKAGAAGESQAT